MATPLNIIDLGAFCVELRPFYCNRRMLVPMSYITGTRGRHNLEFAGGISGARLGESPGASYTAAPLEAE